MNFVFRDGQRLTPYMLQQINALDAAFHAEFGVHLVVTSGIRTAQEQINIFLARYVKAGAVNGRRVYDTRVWNGVRYYRISNAGTVAVPSFSNHEVQKNWTAAVDLRDTGSDAGVSRAGTNRANWLRANAGRFGLVASGYGFGEPWHFDIPNFTAAIAAGGGNVPGFSERIKREQEFLNAYQGEKLDPDGVKGPKFRAAVSRYQDYLRARGWNPGKTDGDWGDGTQRAHTFRWAEIERQQAANNRRTATVADLRNIPNKRGLQKVARLGGYRGNLDNDFGPGSQQGLQNWLNKNYNGSLAGWLRSRWGYTDRDNFWGPNMAAAASRADAANWAQL